MIELIKYQLIVTICIIVFYGFYKIFLKDETFFNFNRFLILFLISISFAIPFVKIGTSLPIVPQKPNIITIGQSSAIVPQPIAETKKNIPVKTANQPTPINWNLITLYAIGIINLAGILWGLIRLIKSLFFFRYLRRKSEIATFNSTKFYIVPETIGSFSFFKSIFISKETINKGEVGSILAHELTHITEHHSIDSIFLALVKSFLWFNPIIYLFEKELKTIHEYIADSSVIEQEQDKNNYIDILLNQTIGPKMFDLTNNFNSTTIFRRIKMITKAKSTKRTLWKYLVLILPLTFTLYAFSFSEQKLTKAIGNGAVKNAVENYLTLSMVAPAEKSDDITASDTVNIANLTKEDYSQNDWGTTWQNGLDKMPRPLPTVKDYLNLVISQKRTPEEAKKHNITCRLFIEFDVNPDSTLSNFKFSRGMICGDSETTKPIGYGLTQEAMRVMKIVAKTARWQPGIAKGKPVVSKGLQMFFFGDIDVWKMYNAPANLGCGAINAEISITNPCKRNYFTEPSWFLDKNFTQILKSMGLESKVYQDKSGGKVEISFGATPDGKPDKPEVVKSNNKAFADLALKGVNSLEGLKVNGFNHKGKRYNMEIGYVWTEQTTEHKYKIDVVPAEKK
jgi:beta-lactamase regulating signal transducer with metallopeptidase domain